MACSSEIVVPPVSCTASPLTATVDRVPLMVGAWSGLTSMVELALAERSPPPVLPLSWIVSVSVVEALGVAALSL